MRRPGEVRKAIAAAAGGTLQLAACQTLPDAFHPWAELATAAANVALVYAAPPNDPSPPRHAG